ncbi:hypothetical protein B0T16DRAFT_78120 [Cercophora newfieldiana]|uniref:Uncharacterized protein n=1 Tax=Cercophora newfieldiana TaxID=92897 RepID=A0AA39YEX8_9PEZI|nr:hypothetical protein B0T16DRAFT_78120 [Cercophora newfieldiana]
MAEVVLWKASISASTRFAIHGSHRLCTPQRPVTKCAVVAVIRTPLMPLEDSRATLPDRAASGQTGHTARALRSGAHLGETCRKIIRPRQAAAAAASWRRRARAWHGMTKQAEGGRKGLFSPDLPFRPAVSRTRPQFVTGGAAAAAVMTSQSAGKNDMTRQESMTPIILLPDFTPAGTWLTCSLTVAPLGMAWPCLAGGQIFPRLGPVWGRKWPACLASSYQGADG